MKAFVSGQAGAAVVIGLKPQVRPVNGSPRAAWHSADALRVFDGCSDVHEVTVEGVEELDRRAETAWAADRAMRLFLFLLDPAEPPAELEEYAECLAELLNSYSILQPLQRRLAAAPLPGLVEVVRVEEACASAEPVRALFQWLLAVQSFVARVREAYDAVPPVSFGGENEKARVQEQLVEGGAFFDIVTELAGDKDLGFLRLKVANRHPSFSDAIAQWFAGLQGGLRRLPKDVLRTQAIEIEEEDELFDAVDAVQKQPSYATFQQVKAQQAAIIAKLKDRDIDGARWLMSGMIALQEIYSSSEQIAKSLSAMAQQAKLQDVPDLQLEWARRATEVNPFDPVAFGHLADALIDVGAYAEAEAALDAVKRNGDPLFAASGRARILRALGQIREAREAFVAAA